MKSCKFSAFAAMLGMGLAATALWAEQVDATGGTISYHTTNGVTYRIHTFTAPGAHDFNVTRGGEVEYLVVGGGGGGARNGGTSGSGAGGGGGGMLTGTVSVTVGPQPVVVGDGGLGGGPETDDLATPGGNSAFMGIEAIGGGEGAYWQQNGGNGGSGGGAGGKHTDPRMNPGSGIPGQGHDGGPGYRIAGAGGGAGAPAEDRTVDAGRGSHGGIGLPSGITGTTIYYGGGGGSGAKDSAEPGGFGGLGGGGNGGDDFELGFAGDDGLGGGGGGAGNGASSTGRVGGDGGSGIVVIRYEVLSVAVTKSYDGDNHIDISQCVLVGADPADDVYLETLTGTYVSGRNVQTGGALNLTAGPVLGGDDAGKYSVATPMTGDITPRELTIAVTKQYDGNDAIDLAQCALEDVVSGDSVTLTTLAGVYDDGRYAQTNGPLTVTDGPALGGAHAGNYTVATPATGNITTRDLTVIVTKIYDGDNQIKVGQCLLDGVLPGDTVTLAALSGTYDLGAGGQTGGPLTLTDGPELAGADAFSYTPLPPATGDISVFLYSEQGDNSIRLTRYVGVAPTVAVPATLEDKPVTAIGGVTFADSTVLTAIDIPAGITNIATGAFDNTASLTAIRVAGANAFYSSTAGVLFNKSGLTLLRYPPGRGGAYIIPYGVALIDEKAFQNCVNLTGVTMPASLAGIGRQAFAGCTGLSVLNLPDSVTAIGMAAFQGCSGLTEANLGAGPATIGEQAFAACTHLAVVRAGAGIDHIGNRAFWDCAGLRGAYFEGDAPGHGIAIFSGAPGVVVYYRPDTAGWGATYAERPTALWHHAAATPVFSPAGGAYTGAVISVSVNSATDGAVIRYTIDGREPGMSSPLLPDNGRVELPLPGILQARAWHPEMEPSAIKSAAYQSAAKVAAPVFDPMAGAFTGAQINVTITCTTAGATIRYTMDGSEPDVGSPVVANGGVVAMDLPGTLRARAWRSDLNPSTVSSANYTRHTPDPPGPQPDPEPDPLAGPSLRANGRRGTLTVAYPAPVTITVTADYGRDAGIAADWWVVAIPDYGRYWYYLDGNMQWITFPGGERNLGLCRPVYRGPLQNISRPVVLLPATTLPRGTYYIYMAVGPRDGILNPAMLWDIDMLTVIVE